MSNTNKPTGGYSIPKGCTPLMAFIAIAFVATFGLVIIAVGLALAFPPRDWNSFDESRTRLANVFGEDANQFLLDQIQEGDEGYEPESAVEEVLADEAPAGGDANGSSENPSADVPSDEAGEGVQAPVEAPAEVADPAEEPAPALEPEPESTSTSPELVTFAAPAIGLDITVFDHYSYGSMVDKLQPYSFVKPGACGMRVDVYPMPTADLPGATALDAVNGAYQAEVASNSSSYSWNPLGPAYELEVKGQPAARLEVERVAADDKRSFFQFTVIRGDAKSAIVVGQVGNKCGSRTGAENLPALSEITDTVRLSPQLPVCYVGKALQEDDYSVACDQWGGTGASILMQGDHPDVVLGPTTWDECARFMRKHNQPGWEQS